MTETSPGATPNTRGVIAASPGGPEALTLVQQRTPQLNPNEVLIKVAAAGVNRADVLQRQGRYPPPRGAGPVLGLEVSGAIASAGAAVAEWTVGDQACALLAGGGYADYVAVDAGSVLPVPKGVSLQHAGALPEAAFTVWTNVVERGGLTAGETLLVHGGASGIGTAAIQIGTALGARVFATAGSDEKCALCAELGAVRAINYRTEEFEEIMRRVGGADVVLDMVGGRYVQKNISTLKTDGRLVNIAFMSGSRVEIDLMRVMLKRLTLTGSTLRAQPVAEKARLAAQVRAHVWPMIESGAYRPVIDSVFPLEEMSAAHQRMESGEHAGKILLTP